MIRRFGVRQTLNYERERKRRERHFNRPFIPWLDGEPLLRALGCSDEEIERAKEHDLA